MHAAVLPISLRSRAIISGAKTVEPSCYPFSLPTLPSSAAAAAAALLVVRRRLREGEAVRGVVRVDLQ